jgi:hypothetical protein
MDINIPHSCSPETDVLLEEIRVNGACSLKPRKSTNSILFLLSLNIAAIGITAFLPGELFGLAVAGFFGIGVFIFGCAALSYLFLHLVLMYGKKISLAAVNGVHSAVIRNVMIRSLFVLLD